jgi:hypothetical protein
LNKSKTNPWKELQTSAKLCTDYARSGGIREAHSFDFGEETAHSSLNKASSSFSCG